MSRPESSSSSSLGSKLLGLQRVPNLPVVSSRDLSHPDGYKVLDCRRVETRFGVSIVCEILMPDDSRAVTYLPSRFHQELSDEDLMELRVDGWRVRATGMTGRSVDLLFYKV